MITSSSSLTGRDRAVLRAVAAGRCATAAGPGAVLTVDGVPVCDQFAGPRLLGAGLIATSGPAPAPARLTSTGRALLHAA